MNLRRYLLRFWKQGRNECAECERLSQEEADAAIELVGADDAFPRGGSPLDRERWQRQRDGSESRLRDAKERLAAHRGLRHSSCSMVDAAWWGRPMAGRFELQ
jgi:hypothetical protein